MTVTEALAKAAALMASALGAGADRVVVCAVECALTSARGWQGPLQPGSSTCCLNDGQLAERVGCFACGRYCCGSCLAACAAAIRAFEADHSELRVDGQGSPAMLAVADGRAARAAGDADAAAQLVAAGMGSMAGGIFHFNACALCSRDGPSRQLHNGGGHGSNSATDDELEEDDVEDEAPHHHSFRLAVEAAPLQVRACVLGGSRMFGAWCMCLVCVLPLTCLTDAPRAPLCCTGRRERRTGRDAHCGGAPPRQRAGVLRPVRAMPEL